MFEVGSVGIQVAKCGSLCPRTEMMEDRVPVRQYLVPHLRFF